MVAQGHEQANVGFCMGRLHPRPPPLRLVYIMYLMRTTGAPIRGVLGRFRKPPRTWPPERARFSASGSRPRAAAREAAQAQIGEATVRLRNVPPLVSTKAREPKAEGVMLAPSDT